PPGPRRRVGSAAPVICARPQPIFSPRCARSTGRTSPPSLSCRSRSTASASRSTTASAAPPRRDRREPPCLQHSGGRANANATGRSSLVTASAEPGIAAALARRKEIAAPKGRTAAAASMAPFPADERGLYHGAARLVVRPGSTEEVAAVVRECAAARLPIVPQGGNTGLVGGAVPSEDGRAIVLSLQRMNRVRAVDPLDHTITVEAGCILAEVQKAAEDADRLFPLSLGAEGSCQIGGNLSTNAGGIAVLRYGNMRDLTLGLEVVLPDGEVLDALRSLRKDNTGYDLKQLFIGAE